MTDNAGGPRPVFDLLDEPWIPCLTKQGGVQELGLRATLARAHELAGIAGDSPPVTAALYRLLLAVLHRVFGPEDEDEWAALHAQGRFDAAALDAYLERWRPRFDLFAADRPFYQADDSRVKPKAVNRLIPEVASGNNATLFDHNLDSEPLALSPARAARALVAAQAFALGGLSGIEEKFTQGPCVGGAIFLLQRDTLFATLLANLCPYPNSTFPTNEGDLPTWEQDDPFAGARRTPRGYLDYLTWQSRRIRLFPAAGADGPCVREMTEGPGLRLEAGTRNPLMHYRKDKDRGLVAMRFSAARALWRDSAALLSLWSSDIVPPQPVAWAAELAHATLIRPGQHLRLTAFGIANDQAKIEFHRMDSLPVPPEYLTTPELVDALSLQLLAAEEAQKKLYGALSELARRLLAPDYDQADARQPDGKDVQAMVAAWDAAALYWAGLDLPFLDLLQRLPAAPDAAVAEWVAVVQRSAWDALESVAGNLPPTPRHLKAAVSARDALAAGLRKQFPVAESA